jgi:hypothetical protein
MRQCQKTFACGLAVLMAGGAAWGITETTNPFQKIVDRNVFGLKDPPPPPSTEPPKAPMPKITFTGIITFGGKKRALLKTPPPLPKPGEQPKGEQYYTVELGGQDREMEVLAIDEKAGTVKVKYAGSEPIDLSFADNGAKPISAAPIMVPGQPGALPGIPPPPTGTPGFQPGAPGTVPGMKPLPTRTLRLPTPAGQGASTSGGYTPAPIYGGAQPGVQVNTAGGNVSLPTFNMTAPTHPNQASVPIAPEPQLTPEQQMVLMEVQREQNRNNPTFPPLPPTPMSREAQQTARP